jgi:hypothetical protein
MHTSVRTAPPVLSRGRRPSRLRAARRRWDIRRSAFSGPQRRPGRAVLRSGRYRISCGLPRDMRGLGPGVGRRAANRRLRNGDCPSAQTIPCFRHRPAGRRSLSSADCQASSARRQWQNVLHRRFSFSLARRSRSQLNTRKQRERRIIGVSLFPLFPPVQVRHAARFEDVSSIPRPNGITPAQNRPGLCGAEA